MPGHRLLAVGLLLASACGFGQTVQPLISQYKGTAEGKFAITNNTLQPMAVVLQPKSFNITPEGTGDYRALDPGITVELSSTSVRLAPKQTYYIFYKARADKLPAWFTVYSTFSSVQHGEGLDVRILLPHTVYLNQKDPLREEDVHIDRAVYDSETRKILVDMKNAGPDLGRVQEVKATSAHDSASASGFPLLPGNQRHLEVKWEGAGPPETVQLRFEHFTMKQSITLITQ